MRLHFLKQNPLFSWRQSNRKYARTYDRYECWVPTPMMIIEKSYIIEGVMTDISIAGARFRPTYTYLLDRYGEKISLYIDSKFYPGDIRYTNSFGYGIRFDTELNEGIINKVLTEMEH